LAALCEPLLLCEKAPLKRAQNASRLPAGSLRYAIAHSGGTGDGIRFPSKCFQSFEIATSPEYRKAVIACEKLMEQLSQRLSKEDYELVQELRAQTAIAQCEESESHFKYGFSAGLMFSRKPMNKCSRRKKNR